MQHYIFHEGDLPSDYYFVFAAAIFNKPAYRLLQTAGGWSSFYVLDPRARSVHGHLHFHLREGLAVTPLRAPFGSADVSPDIPLSVLAGFLEFAESRLAQAGVSKIMIKNPPDAYQPATARILHQLFVDRDYTIASTETTSIIFVSPTPFSDMIHPRKKRKLKQSSSFPFLFSRLEKNCLPEVYEFISICRMSKKYALSITFDELRRMIDQFPEEYHLFAVYHREKLVAASVAIQVNDKVLYHFISDHIRKIGSFSPALVLMEGIYDFCARQNLQMLDLGTSAPDGIPNSKLLNFKKELGGKVATKFTFIKTLG